MFGALNNEVIGWHLRPEFEAVAIAQGYLCFYCGKPICKGSADPDLEITPDHLLARSRGGSDFVWNIVAACFACNRLKGTKLPGDFLRERWAFAHAVDVATKQSTRIALSKGRQFPGDPDEGVLGSEPFVTAHLEVSDFAATAVNYLDQRRAMPEPEESYWQRRRAILEQQVCSLGRRFLEAAGQQQLPLEMPSSPPKPPQTEEAALTLRGMHVTEKKA